MSINAAIFDVKTAEARHEETFSVVYLRDGAGVDLTIFCTPAQADDVAAAFAKPPMELALSEAAE